MALKLNRFDYDGLKRTLALCRERPFTHEMEEAVIKWFRERTWEEAVAVTEKAMEHGKRELNEFLWKILNAELEAVQAKKNEQKNEREKAALIPYHEQSGRLIKLQEVILGEINAWLNYAPPLRFSGREVVYNPEFYGKDVIGMLNQHELTLESWVKAGRPATWCVLIDEYLNQYIAAMDQEEKTRDFTLLEKTLLSFYHLLSGMRQEQIEARRRSFLTQKEEIAS